MESRETFAIFVDRNPMTTSTMLIRLCFRIAGVIIRVEFHSSGTEQARLESARRTPLCASPRSRRTNAVQTSAAGDVGAEMAGSMLGGFVSLDSLFLVASDWCIFFQHTTKSSWFKLSDLCPEFFDNTQLATRHMSVNAYSYRYERTESQALNTSTV